MLTSGCVAKVSDKWDRVQTAKPDIALSVPFYPQKKYYCGPSSLAMTLEYSGIKSDPDKLADAVFTPSAKGSFQQDMLAGARRNGRIPYLIKSPDDLISQLAQGRPVLVFMNLGLSWHPVWHYAVATGIKQTDGYVIMNSGDTENDKMGIATFDHVWARTGYWGFVLLKPGEIPADTEPLSFIDAVSAFEQVDANAASLSYEAAAEKWKSDRIVMLALGNSFLSRDKKAEAVDIFRHLTEQYPDFGDAWNNLAEALKASGLHSDALWAAERAVKTGGKNLPAYQETLRSIQTP